MMKNESGSQVDFKEKPYEATQWEIVGEYNPDRGFIPMTLDVIDESKLIVDPVFADFGGRDFGHEKRLHLPEEEAFDLQKYDNNVKKDEPKEEENLVKLKQEEVEALKDEFFKKGYEEALNSAREEKLQYESQFKNEINIIIEDLKEQINLYKKDLEKEALDLSIKISQKILNKTINENPSYILEVIHMALDSIKGARIKKIRVSTDSYEFLKNINREKEFSTIEDDFEFVGDETINKGCVVESSLGEANFDLDSAFERIVYGITR